MRMAGSVYLVTPPVPNVLQIPTIRALHVTLIVLMMAEVVFVDVRIHPDTIPAMSAVRAPLAR